MLGAIFIIASRASRRTHGLSAAATDGAVALGATQASAEI
jgi:hypothetical protein